MEDQVKLLLNCPFWPQNWLLFKFKVRATNDKTERLNIAGDV